MNTAYVFFAEGFEEIEAITIVDVLRRAEIPVETVSITGKLPVNGAHDITLHADKLIDDIDFESAAILILPGGQPGANNLNAHSLLKEKLKAFDRDGRKLAAICAAPLVLGGLDILQDKDAVCYPGYEDKLRGARLQNDLSLKSENVITGRGPGAALNFALEIVADLKGRDKASQLAEGMLVQTW